MEVKPGYKQTEKGVIPEQWETSSLKQITLNMLQGVNTAIDKPEYVRDGIPILKANNVIDEEVVFEGADHISRRTFSRYSDRFKLKRNDFLFSNIGARLGTGSLLMLDVECSFAWNVMRIVPNTRKVIPEYLCFLINSPQCSQEIRNKQSGSGMGFVPKGVMQDILVALPPIDEQRAIAEALSDVDALLGALDRLIAKKRDLKQAAMQQLLTGQTRLPGFHGEWEVKRLRDCAQFLSGTYLAQDDYRDGEFEVQGAGSLMGRHDAANYPEPISVIGRVGTVGRPRFMPKGCWVNNNAAAIAAISGIAVPSFIHLLLSTVDWSKATSVTAQPFLVISALMDMAFNLPQVLEQTAIAAVLSDMDAELAVLEQRREKTRALKQGMMQELLTGRTRLI